MPPSRVEFVVLGLLLVSAHSARGQAIGQGFELERAGQYQRAATVYLTTLRGEPTNVAALLGLGRPAAFGIELAELLERVGEWEGAAREWGAALTEAPTQLPNAASSLAEAPAEQRERIVRAVLATEPTPLERRLAGELL